MKLNKKFVVCLKRDAQDFLTFRILDDPKTGWDDVKFYDLIAKSTGVEIVKFFQDELKKLVPRFIADIAATIRYEEIPNNEHFKHCIGCDHQECLTKCDHFNRILYFRNIDNYEIQERKSIEIIQIK